mgnify:CR=1 FL=1
MKDLELSTCFDESLEMIRALNEEGLIIVPSMPSECMIREAQKVCNLSETQLKKIYFAMTSVTQDDLPYQVN